LLLSESDEDELVSMRFYL